ncbi:aldo/keto reductase [Bifidobacterium scardovii]|uniref:Oxidoreductase n=1 Tax=Bifidobacterium scardovii TaxID=158787 RepID=A0A087DK32_9BIFI|nr:aldo/keto reductase [Bifidobacterium scardovii]KFI95882.1 oxidoreductase [Bifidobacterium scardovii]MBS6948062.1 aldo/keto reductase [Bifidobacterium scardovii]MDK6349468.1 aldo/keto reductase [Bifidobacterium scardovii]MDU3737324.1 aldo/keto reductase [Bifidobacterium scardovii]MDU5297319.1 aldo/keto reductase [Bifidobacterium scardovii]
MKRQRIGTSGMTASRVALGVMRMDALDAEQSKAVVSQALESGVDFFDTADIYGFSAHRVHASSEAFGAAWTSVGVARRDIFIQTKFGIVRSDDNRDGLRYDYSAEHLLASLDRELEALRTDYVDSVLLHRIDTLVDPDEVGEVFGELLASGKVRHFGVSNMGPWQIEMLQQALGVTLEVNQLQFGLMHTQMLDAEIHFNRAGGGAADITGGILPYSRLKRMTIQAWSPFQSGTEYGPFVDNPHFPELNAALADKASKYGVSKDAIASAWILRHPANIQVVAGTMNPERLARIAAGADIDLDRQDWWDLYCAAGHQLV